MNRSVPSPLWKDCITRLPNESNIPPTILNACTHENNYFWCNFTRLLQNTAERIASCLILFTNFRTKCCNLNYWHEIFQLHCINSSYSPIPVIYLTHNMTGDYILEEYTTSTFSAEWKWQLCSSDTLVPTYKTTQHHNPEDYNTNINLSWNLQILYK
jgi:hypothetical protein